jgi:hypothetical protein
MTAPWAVRSGHSSVIDAAGAIYVIGGVGGGTYFNDVWISTDGGARPDSRRVLRGYWGYSGCLWGTWVYQGVCGVLEG